MKNLVAFVLTLAASSNEVFARPLARHDEGDAKIQSFEEARNNLEQMEEMNRTFNIRFKEKYDIDQSVTQPPEKKSELQVETFFAEVTAYETIASCGPERSYLESQIQNVPNVFKLLRTDRDEESQSNVPRQCLTFIMKKFFEPAMFAPKRMFAYCAKGSGRPDEDIESREEIQPKIDVLRTNLAQKNLPIEENQIIEKKIRALEASVKHKYYMQPCVTETYVQTVYNSFTDVANCFNIPQKEILPKFFNESGFHINAFGAGKDAGVGQLTFEAIEASAQRLPYYIAEMKKSTKASCHRLSEQASAFENVNADLFERCNLMAAPENPLRNLFYAAIFYRESVRYVSGIAFRADGDIVVRNDGREMPLQNKPSEELGGALERLQIRDKFTKLGFKNVNLHRLKTMVVSLGYNSGTRTALNRLDDYLSERILHMSEEKNLSLSAKHFDFENTDVSRLRKAIMPQMAKKEATEEERQVIERMEVARQKNLPEIYAKAYRLSFPEFLVLRTNSGPHGKEPFQLYGFPGYLSALALKNKILLAQFPGRECSAPGYLSLAK